MYPNIKSVKEVSNYEEVNGLLNQNWILIEVVPSNGKIIYVLGERRIPKEN